MLDKIKEWLAAQLKEHRDGIITVTVIIMLAALLWWAVDRRTARLTAQHIESIAATQTQTKEVKTNAETVRRLHAENDNRTAQTVEKARRSVPDDLTALVDMANEIIRDSRTGQR